MQPEPKSPARSASWLVGLVFGVLGGLVALEVPILGLPLVGIVALLLGRGRSRTAGPGGVLTGVGATWLSLLGRTAAECRAFNASPEQSCTAPGIEPYLAVAAVILIGGIALTAVAFRSRGS